MPQLKAAQELLFTSNDDTRPERGSKALRERSYITRGGVGDLRGGPENFLHEKGGDLKCFQNTGVRT